MAKKRLILYPRICERCGRMFNTKKYEELRCGTCRGKKRAAKVRYD